MAVLGESAGLATKSESEPRRVRASLRLAFERDERTGATFLASSAQQPPLRVVRSFAQPDGAALAHLHNVSGGLLGGDALALDVRVGAGASVQLTTTGATRIYRPRRESLETSQRTELFVGENALLEYLPDAIIPFAGVRYDQHTNVRLARGAGIFWWEILAPGRGARGERFEYESVAMNCDITAEGRLIVAERVRLDPRERPIDSPARLGRYRYWATFYICRVGLEAARWLALEHELREATEPLAQSHEALWGVSALPAHGVVVRCVAVHGRDVLPGLQAVWRAAKWSLYGREAVPPRKVN
jgi:urease accessory protein